MRNINEGVRVNVSMGAQLTFDSTQSDMKKMNYNEIVNKKKKAVNKGTGIKKQTFVESLKGSQGKITSQM